MVETPVMAIITDPITKHKIVTQRNITILCGPLTVNLIFSLDTGGLTDLLMSYCGVLEVKIEIFGELTVLVGIFVERSADVNSHGHDRGV